MFDKAPVQLQCIVKNECNVLNKIGLCLCVCYGQFNISNVLCVLSVLLLDVFLIITSKKIIYPYNIDILITLIKKKIL